MSNQLNLQKGKQYFGICHEIFDFYGPDPFHRTVQGAYFDGKNYYVAMVQKMDDGFETTRITVLDAEGNFVRASDPLFIDHANNLTYHAKRNTLIVSHCQSPDGHYNRYSAVDLRTLTVTETADLTRPFFALAYDAEKDAFVSGEWAGQTIDYWDAEMRLTDSFSVACPKTLSQGAFCDDEYCYFVRSGQNGVGAEIRVYDWKGELCFVIPLQIEDQIEPESINIFEGIGYVLCNHRKEAEKDGIAYRLEMIEGRI